MNIRMDYRRSIRSQVRLGGAVVVFLVLGVGGWAVATEIAGAVIAAGSIVVDSSVKKVQHPGGGIVGELRVRDGDRVNAGDVLLRLDDTMTRTNLGVVTKALDELAARRARLEAERDGSAAPAFPDDLIARASDSDVINAIASEEKLFHLRKSSRQGQKEQLGQRIEQLQKEIEGLIAQEAGKGREGQFVARELTGIRSLWEQRLVPLTRLTTLERDTARLEGERAQIAASIAQARGKIAETELQILQLERDLSSEVAKELREIDARMGELTERKAAAADQMRRIDVLAPQNGIVHQMAVHTVGGVVAAGETMMLIVPSGDNLIVEARLAPKDIDQVFVGQRVALRFSGLNQRTTPTIEGTLRQISADVAKDPRTDAPYYTMRIDIEPDQLALLDGVQLLPGMPVETFVRTTERNVASYLAKPLGDQIARAFRER